MVIYMTNKIGNRKTTVKKRNPITGLLRRAKVLLPNVSEWRWCLYDAANSAFSLIVATTMFPVFYKFLMPAGAPDGRATAGVGFANSAAGFAAAIAMPMLGALADRRGARKLGVWCAVSVGCLCTLLLAALNPGMTQAALVIYALAFFSFTGGNVFYDSMLVDVTERRRMDYISALGFGVGYIGSVIPFVAVLAAMFRLGEGGAGFRFAFILTAVWWAVWSLPLLLGRSSSTPKTSAPDSEAAPFTASILWRTAREIWRDRNLRVFLCAYFLYIDGVDTLIVMAVPYGKEVGLGTTEMIAVILGIQIVAFPCAMLYGVLASRFGAKKMIGVGIASYAVTVLIASLMPFIPSRGVKSALFITLALLVAANQGGIQALSRSCYGRLIPPERSAEYFGFYNIFGKFAAVIGPALVGLSGLFLGGSQYGMFSLMLLFAAGGWLLSRTRID